MTARLLKNALVPNSLIERLPGETRADGLTLVDLALQDGRLVETAPEGAVVEDLDGRLVLPGLVDAHVHLDKTYIVSRTGAARTGLEEAVLLAIADIPNRSAEDLRGRMDRAIARALRNGTTAMRTHLDSMQTPSENPAWGVLSEMRARWAGLMTLEAVALMRIERALEPGFAARCADIAAHGGLAGGYVSAEGCPPEAVDAFFLEAAKAGLDVDFHVDESLERDAIGIENVLDSLARTGFKGRVTLSHCCALAAMPEARAEGLIARMAMAGVQVVSLPFSNLYLQDRVPGRTARMRGLTLVQELRAAGVPVAFASDNVQDPFYPFGNYDLLEILRQGMIATQLEAAPEDWIASITATPAGIMGLPIGRIAPGAAADLVVFDAQDWTDLLSRAHEDRRVIRAGRDLSTLTLPPALEAR